MRDIRTLNQSSGQQIESDEVMTRLGSLSFRNLGSISKAGLFDSGKALIVGNGLRVVADGGMVVRVPTGCTFQRSYDVIGCIQPVEQTVTIDAASGVPRIDIVEAQIKQIVDKTDYASIGTVATGTGGGSVVITNEEIKRDIKYYLAVQKKTSTTTPTAATAGVLTGIVAIPGVIDLSARYLINIADGEDGSFQEVDCRGAVPNATTRAEIIAAINTALGRTAASTGAGNVVVLTGPGTGVRSLITIKPPVSDADKDALQTIFGVSSGGVYKYKYAGVNDWFKLCEIDIGAATVVITDSMIRNIDRKSTWASDAEETLVHDYVYQPNLPEWNKWSSTITYGVGAAVWIEDEQYVSLVAANLNHNPIISPNHWQISPAFNDVCRMFHDARPISAGLNLVDDVTDGAYQQHHFMGYYSKGGKNFEAHKVHLDGSVITGDADLENIFDVGGVHEYFMLDILAPDVLGTRTLPNLEGRLLRSRQIGGTAVGSTEEDQEQGHWHYLEKSDGTLMGVHYAGGTGNVLGTLRSPLASYDDTKAGTMREDTVHGYGAPRVGAVTRDKTYIVGVAYIIVLLEV
jgi:hypothetical protein